jgi:endonuclease IV
MKTKLNSLLLLISVLLTLVAAPGCRNLATDGVYQNDQFLYQAELSTDTSYQLIHAYVSWESENRDALKQWPEIKASADNMRQNSPQWFASAFALHDAYLANPTPDNQQAYQKAINVLRAALTEASKYMAKASNGK